MASTVTLPFLSNLNKGSTNTISGGSKASTVAAPKAASAPRVPYNNGLYAGPYNANLPVINPRPAVPQPVGDGGAAARASASAAAKAAADAAARAAQVNALRGDIGGIVNNIKGTYDSIFGTAQSTAGEQDQQLTQNYVKSVGDVNDQINTGVQQTGAAYTARGVGDSSYAGNATDTVKTAGTKQVDQLGDELKNNRASIGQFVAQKEAERTAQKQGLDSILSHIAESNDPSELTSLRNTLTSRLADLQSSAADVQSNKQYLSKLTSVSPVGERLGALQTVIGNIVKGSAPAELKRSIGISFIQNSGLDDATQQQLLQQLSASIGQQTQQTVAPQTANVPPQ